MKLRTWLVVALSILMAANASAGSFDAIVDAVRLALKGSRARVLGKHRVRILTYENRVNAEAIEDVDRTTLVGIEQVQDHDEMSLLQLSVYSPKSKARVVNHNFKSVDYIPSAEGKITVFARNYKANGQIEDAFHGELEIIEVGQGRTALQLKPLKLTSADAPIAEYNPILIDYFQIGNEPHAIFKVVDGRIINSDFKGVAGEARFLSRARAREQLNRVVRENANDSANIL
jgi:hypothetical protein